jgi:predicted dienelactone hydrolase
MKEVSVMRLFETLTLITLLLSLLSFFVSRGKRPRWMAFLPSLAVLLVLAHLVLEGYRWQMVPAYVLTVLTFLSTVRAIMQGTDLMGKPSSRGRRALTIIGTVLDLLVLIVAAALPALLPVFRLPEPTGPYAVGTRYFYWIDKSHPDTYTPDPDDYREVSVQVWYPAELTGDEDPIRYMRKEAGRALAEFLDLPSPLFDHFALVRTHAYLNASVAQTQTPFPVITYSPSGLMSSHMALFEELASHGYVVLCIGHPYWNPFVYGADGEVLPFDGQNEYYKAWWAEENATVKEAKEQITVAKTTEAQERAQRWHNQLKPVAIRDLRKWAEDIGFVLDELEKLNSGSGFLAGILDLERVGIMGFSRGGAATGQFCATDERCKAGINLTGFMYGDILDIDLPQPFLFMSQEETWCRDCFVNDLYYKRAESSAYQMKIRGSRHASFGDPCLWGGVLQSFGEGATIDGERMARIQNIYTLAFFDKHLKGLAVSLLDGPSPDYPEIVFKSRHP